MDKIIHCVYIDAPPATVYQAIATQEGLSSWWSTKVKADERRGGIVDFTFHMDFHPDMKITDLVDSRRVSWECVGGHDNWLMNRFSFEIDDRDGGSRLLFVQEYARELPDDVYGNYNYNWGYYLGSLKQYCETGRGLPFSPPE